ERVEHDIEELAAELKYAPDWNARLPVSRRASAAARATRAIIRGRGRRNHGALYRQRFRGDVAEKARTTSGCHARVIFRQCASAIASANGGAFGSAFSVPLSHCPRPHALGRCDNATMTVPLSQAPRFGTLGQRNDDCPAVPGPTLWDTGTAEIALLFPCSRPLVRDQLP